MNTWIPKKFYFYSASLSRLLFPSFCNIFYEINILYLCKLELHRPRWLSPFSKAFRKMHGFFISNTFIGWNCQKIKQMLSNTLRLNFCYLKITHSLHPRYHPKLRDILKNKQKKKYVCIHEIIQLTIMKTKIKMKIKSNRYHTNRPRSRNKYKYIKYKKCFTMMMLICIKQHLCNIWGSIHEKVKQHWGWVEKKLLLIKKTCISLSRILWPHR